MAITNTSSSVRPEVIPVDGTALVTMTMTAAPAMLAEPIDIVLVLESTKMMGGPIHEEVRQGAKALLDRVAVATGSSHFNPLKNGVRMGLVIYSAQAVPSINLTDDTVLLDAGITAIESRYEGVNQAAALETATGMLEGSTGKKAIVMFTYNADTEGGDAKAAAAAARAKGIQIFGLGPETRRADLTGWVSDPKEFYLCINVGGESMATTFDLVGNRLVAGNTVNAVLNSSVSEDFEILQVVSSSQGTAVVTAPRTLQWQVGDLGLTGPETAELIYEIRHTGTILGKKPATIANLLTSDLEAEREIADPELIVIAACGAGGVYVPEGCPKPVEIRVPACADAVMADLGAIGLASLGRVVRVDFRLKGVCPGKRVAVTVLLEELDSQGAAMPRGVKHLLIPARTGTACEDVEVKCVEFSVPEELDPSGALGSVCNTRSFQARAIANYVDTDFVCCDQQELRV